MADGLIINMLINSNKEFASNLQSAWSEWACYRSDPFRHDFCEVDCDCEDNFMDTLVTMVIPVDMDTPILRDQIENYIRDY